MRNEIDPFFAQYDEDLDGPLDAVSMQNEFGAFDPGTWALFLQQRGITLVSHPKGAKQTLAPHRNTPRARLDMRGMGATRQHAQCAEWEPVLVAHVALHNRILDFSNDMPASERKVRRPSPARRCAHSCLPALTCSLLDMV